MVHWLMLGHTIYIGNGKMHDSGLVSSGPRETQPGDLVGVPIGIGV